LLAGCGPRSLSIDPAIEKLIPPDTIFVAAANLEALGNTPLFGKLAVDDRKNLSQLVWASNGKSAILLSHESSGKPGGLPVDLRRLMRTIAPDRQVWAAFVDGLQGLQATVRQDSNLGQAIRMLRGVERGTAGMDLRNGLDFQSNLLCHTDNDARHVHDAVRFITGMAGISDLVKVVQNQQRVEITAHVAPDREEKFLDLWLNGPSGGLYRKRP
jgi:hypothetical protein